MVVRKRKKNEMIVKPDKGKDGAIIEKRPYALWEDMDYLFDQFRTNFEDLVWTPYNMLGILDQNRMPSMDVIDHGDKYEMNVELPGVPKEDINVEVTPYSIEISAEHEDAQEDKGKNWLKQERSSTNFYRCLELPEELKTDDIKAEMTHGVLKLTLPKVEPKPKHESKKIKIE